MSDPPESRKSAGKGARKNVDNVDEATRELALLNEQAKGLRAELKELRHDVAQVKQELTAERASELRRANEELVLAALHAETVADAAVSSLDELARSAYRDPLTDIANRTLMLDRVQSAIALAQRNRSHIALLFIDLDDFKRINDTLGHAVGDSVLQLIARRLELVVRHSDTVGRYGGDEFLVLINGVSHSADVERVASKVLATFAEPGHAGEHVINLSASIGIAVYPEDGEDAPTLIERADAAMYAAKKHTGSFKFYKADASSDHSGETSTIDSPTPSEHSSESAPAEPEKPAELQRQPKVSGGNSQSH